jgi:hypothetical protein
MRPRESEGLTLESIKSKFHCTWTKLNSWSNRFRQFQRIDGHVQRIGWFASTESIHSRVRKYTFTFQNSFEKALCWVFCSCLFFFTAFFGMVERCTSHQHPFNHPLMVMTDWPPVGAWWCYWFDVIDLMEKSMLGCRWFKNRVWCKSGMAQVRGKWSESTMSPKSWNRFQTPFGAKVGPRRSEDLEIREEATNKFSSQKHLAHKNSYLITKVISMFRGYLLFPVTWIEIGR